MSLSARNFLSLSRSFRSLTKVSADSADNRSDTPKDWLGDIRSFTFGTKVVRLFHISPQLSPGWTSVEYVSSPRPLPRSINQLLQTACARLFSREHCLIFLSVAVGDRAQQPIAINIQSRQRNTSEFCRSKNKIGIFKADENR